MFTSFIIRLIDKYTTFYFVSDINIQLLLLQVIKNFKKFIIFFVYCFLNISISMLNFLFVKIFFFNFYFLNLRFFNSRNFRISNYYIFYFIWSKQQAFLSLFSINQKKCFFFYSTGLVLKNLFLQTKSWRRSSTGFFLLMTHVFKTFIFNNVSCYLFFVGLKKKFIFFFFDYLKQNNSFCILFLNTFFFKPKYSFQKVRIKRYKNVKRSLLKRFLAMEKLTFI